MGKVNWSHVSRLVSQCLPFTPPVRTRTASQLSVDAGDVPRLSFNDAMEKLVSSFGESMPHQSTFLRSDRHKRKTAKREHRPLTFLHCGLFSTKEAVFSEFRKHGIVPEKTPSRSMLRWWETDWWHVKIKHWQPFAKCDDCVTLRAKLLLAPTETIMEVHQRAQEDHRERISLGRGRYAFREELTKSDMSKFLHVSVDAMDNKKTNLPQTRHLSHTKKNAGGEVLKTRLMGKHLSTIVSLVVRSYKTFSTHIN